jgi:hypothetical protein
VRLPVHCDTNQTHGKWKRAKALQRRLRRHGREGSRWFRHPVAVIRFACCADPPFLLCLLAVSGVLRGVCGLSVVMRP